MMRLRLKNKRIYIVFFTLLLFIVLIYTQYPKLEIITGFSAKNMSSSVFIGNRSVEYTDSKDNNFLPVNLANDIVDRTLKTSVATVFGLKERKAVFREGLGSVLINDSYDPTMRILTPNRHYTKTGLEYPYGELPQKDTIFEYINYDHLKKAANDIFDLENTNEKKTRAVLIIHKDKIIYERYAKRIDLNSKLLGWSMTKSVLATVYGVLSTEKAIDINDQAPISAWQNDERKEITIRNLLQMNCGLAWDEDYNSISDATSMLYIATDMTTPQIYKKAIAKPNTHWYYSSGVTNMLSGILRKHFDEYQDYLDYPYKSFIDKIGMHSMIIETDLAGNYVGSSYAWATVRDWAKLGLLYLHRGKWNGNQIFNSEWVDFVTTPSPTSEGDYGGHFWLNSGGFYPDAPRDMYSANGYQGQRVMIIPSKDLVIVRFGLVGDSGVDFNTFINGVTNAINN